MTKINFRPRQRKLTGVALRCLQADRAQRFRELALARMQLASIRRRQRGALSLVG